MIALGGLFFGFDPVGSIGALLVVILTFSAVLAALGVAIALWSPSEEVALSLSNVIGMLAAGIGGSFCTVSSFPEWAQQIALFSPAYWALDAVHAVSLDGASVASILPQLGMLGVFFVLLVAAVVMRIIMNRGKPARR